MHSSLLGLFSSGTIRTTAVLPLGLPLLLVALRFIACFVIVLNLVVTGRNKRSKFCKLFLRGVKVLAVFDIACTGVSKLETQHCLRLWPSGSGCSTSFAAALATAIFLSFAFTFVVRLSFLLSFEPTHH